LDFAERNINDFKMFFEAESFQCLENPKSLRSLWKQPHVLWFLVFAKCVRVVVRLSTFEVNEYEADAQLTHKRFCQWILGMNPTLLLYCSITLVSGFSQQQGEQTPALQLPCFWKPPTPPPVDIFFSHLTNALMQAGSKLSVTRSSPDEAVVPTKEEKELLIEFPNMSLFHRGRAEQKAYTQSKVGWLVGWLFVFVLCGFFFFFCLFFWCTSVFFGHLDLSGD